MRTLLALTGVAGVILILVGLLFEPARWLFLVGFAALVAPAVADSAFGRRTSR